MRTKKETTFDIIVTAIICTLGIVVGYIVTGLLML